MTDCIIKLINYLRSFVNIECCMDGECGSVCVNNLLALLQSGAHCLSKHLPPLMCHHCILVSPFQQLVMPTRHQM